MTQRDKMVFELIGSKYGKVLEYIDKKIRENMSKMECSVDVLAVEIKDLVDGYDAMSNKQINTLMLYLEEYYKMNGFKTWSDYRIEDYFEGDEDEQYTPQVTIAWFDV